MGSARHWRWAAVLAAGLAGPGFADPAAPGEALAIVKGVVAPFAVFGLVHNLQAIPGVERVSFNLMQGLADIRVRAGAQVTDDQIRAAIRKASYTPGEIRWTTPEAQRTPDEGR